MENQVRFSGKRKQLKQVMDNIFKYPGHRKSKNVSGITKRCLVELTSSSKLRRFGLLKPDQMKSELSQHSLGKVVNITRSGLYALVKWNGSPHKRIKELLSDIKLLGSSKGDVGSITKIKGE